MEETTCEAGRGEATAWPWALLPGAGEAAPSHRGRRAHHLRRRLHDDDAAEDGSGDGESVQPRGSEAQHALDDQCQYDGGDECGCEAEVDKGGEADAAVADAATWPAAESVTAAIQAVVGGVVAAVAAAASATWPRPWLCRRGRQASWQRGSGGGRELRLRRCRCCGAGAGGTAASGQWADATAHSGGSGVDVSGGRRGHATVASGAGVAWRERGVDGLAAQSELSCPARWRRRVAR